MSMPVTVPRHALELDRGTVLQPVHDSGKKLMNFSALLEPRGRRQYRGPMTG